MSPPRRVVSTIAVLGIMQLMASMDGPISLLALPRIQNELDMSDAAVSWVVTSYMLAFGGLMVLAGQFGDFIGRKRAFVSGVALFTLASALCAVAWDGGVLIFARLIHGAAAAIIAPTAIALIATTFPVGKERNAAVGVLGAMSGIGQILGIAVGGVLIQESWRLAFLVNLPVGIVVILLANQKLIKVKRYRTELDTAGGALATLACTAAVFGLSAGARHGWLSVATLGPAAVSLTSVVAFTLVERKAVNPIMPLDMFRDRNRAAIFASMFLTGGVELPLILLVTLYFQNILGYSPLRASIILVPIAIAIALGLLTSSRLAERFRPRAVVLCGAGLLAGMTLYGSTFEPGKSYLLLVVPLSLGAFGVGLIDVPLKLSLMGSVDGDRIGAASSVGVTLRSLGGPVVLGFILTIITARTLQLGGTDGPPQLMSNAELRALGHGYAYGLLWLGVVIAMLAGTASFIGYSARQIGNSQGRGAASDIVEA